MKLSITLLLVCACAVTMANPHARQEARKNGDKNEAKKLEDASTNHVRRAGEGHAKQDRKVGQAHTNQARKSGEGHTNEARKSGEAHKNEARKVGSAHLKETKKVGDSQKNERKTTYADVAFNVDSVRSAIDTGAEAVASAVDRIIPLARSAVSLGSDITARVVQGRQGGKAGVAADVKLLERVDRLIRDAASLYEDAANSSAYASVKSGVGSALSELRRVLV